MAMGQSVLSVSQSPIHGKGFVYDTDIHVIANVRNVSQQAVDVLWRQNAIEKPVRWRTWVCGPQGCDNVTYTSDKSQSVTLEPGQTMQFEVHVNPNRTAGLAQLNYELIDKSNPEHILGTIETTFETTSVTPREDAVAGLRVFPNPAVSYFRIYQDDLVDKIIVYDLAGKPVLNYTANMEGQYDVSALQPGLYLVRLLTSDKSVLKTVRLSKR